MSARMIHPGPRRAERALAVPAHLRPIEGTMPRGATVMQAVAQLFAAHHCFGGVLWLDGLVCAPMHFVLPALSTDGLHAAWYSATHSPAGPVRIETATAMVGWRDGAPFLHCHGIWSDAEGTKAMGHLLPFDSVVAEDIRVRGLGSAEAGFVAREDAETAFILFGPEARPDLVSDTAASAPQQSPSANGFFVRILPGEDVVTAIEALARTHGIVDADLHGIGSIDHVRFEDGSRMDCLATELRISAGHLRAGRAEIDIEVVDIHGTIASGRLMRGNNPVGVTLELLIAAPQLSHITLEGKS